MNAIHHRRQLLTAAAWLGLAYVAALGTMFAALPGFGAGRVVAQLVAVGIPAVFGFRQARGAGLPAGLARVGIFALLAGAGGMAAALSLADLLLKDAQDTTRFVLGTAFFTAVLVFLTGLVGACASWTQRSRTATSSSR